MVPLCNSNSGLSRLVVGSSVEMAKTFLKSHDLTFVDRPKTAAGKYTTYNYKDITWSPYGSYWRQARKICVMELFSAKRLESYEYIRGEELRSLLKTLFSSSGNPINLKDHLSDLSLNVISRMVLGKKYTVKNEGENEIVTPEEFKEMLDELFLLNGVLDIGDSIPWLAFLDYKGEKGLKNYVAKDMVDVLLQLADDPNLEVRLERNGVKGFTQGDPSIWNDPNEFCPERFLGKEIDVKGHDFELLPFGAGRRMCPGYPLGIKVIQASLANLLHGFKWKLPGDMKKEDLNMEEIFGLSTPRKFPLVVVAEPRLPSHVYSL
ncbi:hypothetical protein GH714_018545 [Hevea brasiliensis]|uniref:Cytochrome P450 n=1 Tax=Hevea brasiliensis TaxID=3981 RepID=A0A6A6LHL7_HEVBR|nr:hypothetical protein GH714_018545 [Hevea brasiliensis]